MFDGFQNTPLQLFTAHRPFQEQPLYGQVTSENMFSRNGQSKLTIETSEESQIFPSNY